MNLAYVSVQIKKIDEALEILEPLLPVITDDDVYSRTQLEIENAICALRLARPQLVRTLEAYSEQEQTK